MSNLRNFLKAGSFLEVVPIGVPLVAKYRPEGSFQSVYYPGPGHIYAKDLAEIATYDESVNTVFDSSKFVSILTSKHLIPSHVNTQGGSLSVLGMLVTSSIYPEDGEIPKSLIEQSYKLSSTKADFKFLAIDASSNNVTFGSGIYVKNWLKLQSFETCPSHVVPISSQASIISQFYSTTEYASIPIYGYYQIDGNMNRYWFGNMYHIDTITDIESNLDASGYLHETITTRNHALTDSYYRSHVALNLHKKDRVIIDESNNNIVSKYYSSSKLINSSKFTCNWCGKEYEITDDFTVCTNPNCMSHKYPDIEYFLNRIGLEDLPYESYKELVISNKLKKVSDIVSLYPYCDEKVMTTIYGLVDALIPISEVRGNDRSSLSSLCNACNNNPKSVIYYLGNTDEAIKDLGIDLSPFKRWLSNSVNLKELKELCEADNVTLQEFETNRNLAPIFRGKKIYITGQFSHGSESQIKSILNSYSAEVIDVFDNSCDLVLVGDIKDSIDGRSILSAKGLGIPVEEESYFFSLYQIDDDLNSMPGKVG